jgi:hypothetical protein
MSITHQDAEIINNTITFPGVHPALTQAIPLPSTTIPKILSIPVTPSGPRWVL